MNILWYSMIGIVGLLIGSFLNVIIYRLPLMMNEEHSTLNLAFPRSFCPCCKKKIPGWYNIPLLSYFILGGKCHACRKPIAYQYPAVESLSLLGSLFAAYHFGWTPHLVAALFFIWILICLTLIDLQHQLLPDQLTLSLLWLGLICNALYPFVSLENAVLSTAIAYLSLWSFIKIFYCLTGKIGMGHGDFKLFAAFGAWFGWTQLPLIMMMACTSGAIAGLIYLKIKKKHKDTPIPFGPFLCCAGLISLFWGQEITNYYEGMVMTPSITLKVKNTIINKKIVLNSSV